MSMADASIHDHDHEEFGLLNSSHHNYNHSNSSNSGNSGNSSDGIDRTVRIRGFVFTVRQIAKACIFVLIAGMHFNSFVYLAHVYLQEKRALCHISFLLQFSKSFSFNPSFFLTS